MYTSATLDELDEIEEFEEYEDMGSYNHGYIQVRLDLLFEKTGNYTAVNEVSLDISGVDLSKFELKTKEEIKPDICLYPKRGLSQPKDILRMKEMPILAVEILSPKQGSYEVLEKLRLYFELGIRSCWFVEPAIHTVTVYKSFTDWQTYTRGEVVDETLGIRIASDEIFA